MPIGLPPKLAHIAQTSDVKTRATLLLKLAETEPALQSRMDLLHDALQDDSQLGVIAQLIGQSTPSYQNVPKVHAPQNFSASPLGVRMGAMQKPRGPKNVSERAMRMTQKEPAFFPPSEAAAVEARFNVPAGSYLRLDDVVDHLLADGSAIAKDVTDFFYKKGGDPEADPMERPVPPEDKLAMSLMRHFVMSRMNSDLRYNLTRQEVETFMVSALVTSLAEVADPHGRVSVGKMLSSFGDEGASLLLSLSKSMKHGTVDVQSKRARAKYRHLPSPVAELVAMSAKPLDVDTRMEGFWKIVDEIATPDTFEGYRMMTRGHLTESTEVLLRAFVSAGMEPGTILGKSYSANPDMVYQAQKHGWDTDERTLKNPEIDMDNILYPFWNAFERTFANATKVLMVDDGFELTSLFEAGKKQGKELPPWFDKMVAVEQTEKGRHKYHEHQAKNPDFKLDYPVHNMAGSWLKKQFESPAIGESIAFQIEHELWECHPDLKIDPKEAAIIGFGAVGQATADRLKARGYKVFVYDIDPSKMKEAADAGYDVGGYTPKSGRSDADEQRALSKAREKVFEHGHLFVGCTPCECIARDEYDMLPDHAVLSNAGSGYHILGEPEAAQNPSHDKVGPSNIGTFGRQKMDKAGENIDGEVRLAMPGLVSYKDIPGAGDVLSDELETVDGSGMRHNTFKGLDLVTGDAVSRDRMYHRVARDGDKERLVLRNGGVVNIKFDLPPEYAQVTRALLFASSVTAVQAEGAANDFVELPDDLQKRMLEIITDDLESKGLSITEPDFMKTPPLGSEAFVEAMRQREALGKV